LLPDYVNKKQVLKSYGDFQPEKER
jgi:hypothetical protein